MAGVDPFKALSESQEELVDIDAGLKERGIIGKSGFSKAKFQDSLPIASRIDSPSLQRNQISELSDTINITLTDRLSIGIPLLPGNDFGEADVDEVAKMGLFDGDDGRSLYNSFKARDSFNSPSVERRGRSLSEILVPLADLPPAPETIDEVLPLPLKQLLPTTIGGDRPANEIDLLPEFPPILDGSSLIEPSIPNQISPIKSQAQAIHPPARPSAQAQAVTNISIDALNSPFEGRSRLEQFHKKLLELEHQTTPPKPKRRARLRRRSPVPQNQTVLLEANDRLVTHRRRPKKLSLHPVRVHKIDLNFCLEDVEHFGDDEANEDYSVIELPLPEVFIDELPGPPQVLLEDLPPASGPAYHVTPVDISHVAKRRRIDLTEEATETITNEQAGLTKAPDVLKNKTSIVPPPVDDFIPDPPFGAWNRPSDLRREGSLNVPNIDDFICPANAPDRSSTAFVSALRDTPVETPTNAFLPRVTSTANALKKSLGTITNDDIEFAVLRHVSERSLKPEVPEKSAVESILESLKRPKSSRTEDVAKIIALPKPASEKPTTFRTVEGKHEMMVEMVVNGKVEQYSAYWMETMALYLQTRFLMKERGTWKMKFDDVISRVGMLNEKRSHIVESRYLMLAKYGFFKLKLDDDENHIVEVEIPIKEK